MKKAHILLLTLALPLFLTACGPEQPDEEKPPTTGTIAFDLTWNAASSPRVPMTLPPGETICTYYQIDTINAVVLDPSGQTVAEWSRPCDDPPHPMTVADIPPGTVSLSIEVLAGTTAAWRGAAGEITVVAGRTADAGTVFMTYTGGDHAQWARSVSVESDYTYYYAVSAAPDGSVYAAGTSAAGSSVLMKYSRFGAEQWVRTSATGSAASAFTSVSAAPDGSVYAAGYISGTDAYDFGNGITAQGYGSGKNIVLVKYSGSGEAQWARTVTAAAVDLSEYGSVSVASDGSVYAAGYIWGADTYGFGNSVYAQAPYELGNNLVLVKYNSSGEAQWTRTVTGAASSRFYGVSVAPDGSVYAAGYIIGTSPYFFGNGVSAAGADDPWNTILVKYDSAGEAQWARTVTAGNHSSSFFGVSAAPDGSVYAVGQLYRPGAYNFGNAVIVQGPSTSSNMVLVKYDGSGEAQWARSVSAGSTETNSLLNGVSAASDGSVYAAGFIMGAGAACFANDACLQVPNGGYNILLVRYNSSGEAQWARTETGGNGDSLFSGVSAASDGSVYAAGYIYDTLSYDFGNGATAAGTHSGYNSLLVKYY